MNTLYALIIFALAVYFAAMVFCSVCRMFMLRTIDKAWNELQALILKKAALITPLRRICDEHKLIYGDLAKTLKPAHKSFVRAKTRRELLGANKKLSHDVGRVVLTLSQNKQTAASEEFADISEQNAALEQKINFLEIFFAEHIEKYHTFADSLPYMVTGGLVLKKRRPLDSRL